MLTGAGFLGQFGAGPSLPDQLGDTACSGFGVFVLPHTNHEPALSSQCGADSCISTTVRSDLFVPPHRIVARFG